MCFPGTLAALEYVFIQRHSGCERCRSKLTLEDDEHHEWSSVRTTTSVRRESKKISRNLRVLNKPKPFGWVLTETSNQDQASACQAACLAWPVENPAKDLPRQIWSSHGCELKSRLAEGVCCYKDCRGKRLNPRLCMHSKGNFFLKILRSIDFSVWLPFFDHLSQEN